MWITRAAWGAKPLTAWSQHVAPSYRTGVVIHHSVTAEGKSRKQVEATLRQIDDLHRAKGYGGIGYNVVVDYAGRIYRARGVNRMGCHTVNNNARYFGVCYIGDGRKRITPEATKAIQNVVARLQKKSGHKLDVVGHQDLYATACPGDKIYKKIQQGVFDVPYKR